MQQPPYYQQPNVNYPPKKRSWFRRHPLWTALIILLCVSALYGIINDATSKKPDATTTPVATSAPTQPPQATIPPVKAWTTTQTFTGQTHGKTPYFTVQAGWRLKWKCTNSTASSGHTGAVGITAYDHAGKTLSGNVSDPTVAAGHCPPTFFGTTGTSDVQKYGGTMLLEVYATGDWTLDIQALQ